MIHVNRDGFSPDANWVQEAAQLTSQLLAAQNKAERDSIIDDNEEVWGRLKAPLLEKSYGKCWYSESKIVYAYMHVDHFRPKKAAIGKDKIDHGGYWWLTFDWRNYRVCGPVGNINKKDKFAVLRHKANLPLENIADEMIYFLDPTEEQDILKITFNNFGEIMPIDSSGWHFEQARYTIDNLKLNCPDLKEARKTLWNDCYNLIIETQKCLDEDKINPSANIKGQIKEKIKQLKKLVQSTEEFSATAKACFKSSGIDWLISIAV
jgi:uncharacterized protein (TIGR02646 family)